MTKTIDPGTVAGLQHSLGHGEVIVVERGDGPYTELLLDRNHLLLADEPLADGGNDHGPSPYRLLLMALGSCTAMTIRMYATRKAWPLDRVVVRLRHFRVYAEDCAECEKTEARVDRIERVLTLEGPLDDAQRARLLEIAEKCPVHRTLDAGVAVKTRLSDGS